MSKPILALDFDGVIHGYQSGWQGPRNIPDPPVPGALEFIIAAMEHFDVRIFSSRSRYWGARQAMKRWLRFHYQEMGEDFFNRPMWFEAHFAAQIPGDYRLAIETQVIERLKFPTEKPPAMVTLDDRAITFTGTFPEIADLKNFKPWNKRDNV